MKIYVFLPAENAWNATLSPQIHATWEVPLAEPCIRYIGRLVDRMVSFLSAGLEDL